jgi:hypothetical protein
MKIRWLAALFVLSSLSAVAGDEMPWTFNNGEGKGYSIKLVSVEPAAGTPLIVGAPVEIKVTAAYEMSVATEGRVILVLQDEKNRKVGPDNQISTAVSGASGTVTLTVKVDAVPKKSKELRVFVPLVPAGLSETEGEILIRWPVKKR